MHIGTLCSRMNQQFEQINWTNDSVIKSATCRHLMAVLVSFLKSNFSYLNHWIFIYSQVLSQEMRSRTQMQILSGFFNNKVKQRTKTTPKGKNKQAGRQTDRQKTGAQSNVKYSHNIRQRISTGLQTQGDYIGRQTRETQLEPLKQWLRNKMGGDRQSTWEHMAPNKQQAMCSTDRDIWWPAWAHQQDRDKCS